MNDALVTNRRPAKQRTMMSTNAGSSIMKEDSDIPGICVAKFDEKFLANIFGFSHMSDKYRITYDNEKEDAFIVHTPEGVKKFVREGRLYVFVPSQKYLNMIKKKKEKSQYTFYAEDGTERKVYCYDQFDEIVMTKEGNRDGYTDRQYNDAKKAWRLYLNTGGGGIDNFKHYVRQNIIKNCPVTIADINRAERIFVRDVGNIKGRTTRKAPERIRVDKIEIPRELIHQADNFTLFVDIFYVNNLPMLTTIDSPVRYRALVCLDDRTADTIYAAILLVMSTYRAAGFRITRIECDNEFRPLVKMFQQDEQFKEHPITVDCVPQGDHVPEAERNNRTVGERYRAKYHRLPYRTMPKPMLHALGTTSMRELTYFPAKGGISAYFSPHMILNKRNLDFDKHCRFACGEYVQAYQDETITNDNKARTIDAIYLEPTFQDSGGHWVMNIITGARMHKKRCWTVPITQTVINAVESLAESQGYRSLKLLGKNKTRLLPSDWDEDEEYIFDDGYVSDDSEDDADEDDNLDRFEELDENEVDELTGNENNEENVENEENNEENIDENENENIDQAGVPDDVIPPVPIVNEMPPIPEEPEAPNIIEDEASVASSASERPSRARRERDILNYRELGGHQKVEKKKVHFSDMDVEQCHNIMTTDGR